MISWCLNSSYSMKGLGNFSVAMESFTGVFYEKALSNDLIFK